MLLWLATTTATMDLDLLFYLFYVQLFSFAQQLSKSLKIFFKKRSPEKCKSQSQYCPRDTRLISSAIIPIAKIEWERCQRRASSEPVCLSQLSNWDFKKPLKGNLLQRPDGFTKVVKFRILMSGLFYLIFYPSSL
jgi:hypothetical protein